ncbi:YgaP family membrane protein [Thiorhodovibrio frisius]|uniref:Inner membrane protein YgaP-like transmembrane domain-containing protein n=1 Tax=Thiorhodovibrio frisius TaxID=631362 RepID=H8Z6F4_9GAMM|nr:DUF2892 domain-containing protein [Thiorhodovibrio frisius]EIC20738.1 Protein of unknown function (DUF2892) [Thiorhodovibrio frisius]WPL21486.1 hypothetical protein Thiofri_01612 [Thiorhodovibrio frisius]
MRFDYKQPNMGNTDTLIRAIVGALMIIAGFLGGGWIVAVIGAVVLTTAYFRFCPAYALFDFRSNKKAAAVSK